MIYIFVVTLPYLDKSTRRGWCIHDLFLGWTLFTIPWAVAIRFTPLWLTFIGLLCTTIWLYVLQIVSDNLWAVTLLTSAVTWICALTTVITEWMSIKGTFSRQNRWFVSLLSLATIVHVSYLMIAAICEEGVIASVPLASTILLFSAGLWFGWKQKNLFYLSAIPFAILMILLSLFICHSKPREVNIFLFSGIIVIMGTTLLIYTILHLKNNGMAQKSNLTIEVLSNYRRDSDQLSFPGDFWHSPPSSAPKFPVWSQEVF